MHKAWPTSHYFQLEQLAPGVFAAVINKGTGAWANAGIVDLGDRTLIFDTFNVPTAAMDLRRAAVELTGRSTIDYVVNSHCHSDHITGNQVFPDATIISTHRTRELIVEQATSREEARRDIEEGIRRRTEGLEHESDPSKRRGMAYGLSELQASLATVDTLQNTPPTVTFHERLVLHGSERSAELICHGGGHSESDAFLYLPAEGMLFAADLATVEFHPVIAHSAAQWLTSLDHMQMLSVQRVVPGHGPIGTPADLEKVRTYINYMVRYARDLMQRGVPAAELANIPVPLAYADWAAGNVFEWNLNLLYDQLGSEAETPVLTD